MAKVYNLPNNGGILVNIDNLSIEEYKTLIDKYGFEKTWNSICKKLKTLDHQEFSEKIFNFEELGKLYEIGLAYTNKISKKEMGKYYTPKDVCQLMSQMLFETDDEKVIADTGCGTGNLILEALNWTENIEKVYIYDLDKIALNVCEARIKSKFGNRFKVVKKFGDFISDEIKLPKNAKIIANPPYSKIKVSDDFKEKHPAYYQSKDLYVGFMEKILKSASKAVIITPQSFLVGNKFSLIRKQMAGEFEGEIYSFDNVPASVFNGKKEGIFNTNTSNSVRASITYLRKADNLTGFRLTHLIRFKEEERSEVIKLAYLKEQLGCVKQDLKTPLKCFKELENFVYQVINSSTKTISSLLSEEPTEFKLRINNSARYFTVGTKMKLSRDGYYDVYARNEQSFITLYALLNSSYCYMFWRMFDGGILYPKSVLLKTPLPSIEITEELKNTVQTMINKEQEFTVYKMNAGKPQESVKFPTQYRNALNSLLFGNNLPFDLIHQNNETLSESDKHEE